MKENPLWTLLAHGFIFISFTLHSIHFPCSIMSIRSFLKTISIYLSVRPKLWCKMKWLMSDTFTHWPRPEKRKGEEEELQLRERKYSTAAKRFCVKRETVESRRQKRSVSVPEPGGSRLAKDGGITEPFETHTPNMRLSCWVSRHDK